MADRFERVISGSEAIGACWKAPFAGKAGKSVIRMYHFVGNEEALAGHNVKTINPVKAARVGITASGDLRQSRDVNRWAIPLDVIGRSKDHGVDYIFRMPQLDGLHHRRRLGCLQACALSLGHGDRTTIWPGSEYDWKPDAIKARDVRNAGDAELAPQWKDMCERLIRSSCPVRSRLQLFSADICCSEHYDYAHILTGWDPLNNSRRNGEAIPLAAETT